MLYMDIAQGDTVPFLQILTSGGFTALTMYLIVWHLPRKEKECREDLQRARQEYTASLEKTLASMRQYQKEDLDSMLRQQTELLTEKYLASMHRDRTGGT